MCEDQGGLGDLPVLLCGNVSSACFFPFLTRNLCVAGRHRKSVRARARGHPPPTNSYPPWGGSIGSFIGFLHFPGPKYLKYLCFIRFLEPRARKSSVLEGFWSLGLKIHLFCNVFGAQGSKDICLTRFLEPKAQKTFVLQCFWSLGLKDLCFTLFLGPRAKKTYMFYNVFGA